MHTLIYKTLPSTQTCLLERPLLDTALIAMQQTLGIGSRGNSWDTVERALTFSLCLPLVRLPDDLPLQSASIYFAYVMKHALVDALLDKRAKSQDKGLDKRRGKLATGIEDIFIKWPNDIYIERSLPLSLTSPSKNEAKLANMAQEGADLAKLAKIGGVICSIKRDCIVVGIGVNLESNSYAVAIDLAPLALYQTFMEKLQKYPKWKHIFSNYKVEFYKGNNLSAHLQGSSPVRLDAATLQEDGSIKIGTRTFFSMR